MRKNQWAKPLKQEANAQWQNRMTAGSQEKLTWKTSSNYHALRGAPQFSPWQVLISTADADQKQKRSCTGRAEICFLIQRLQDLPSDSIKGPGTQLAAPFICDVCPLCYVFISASLLFIHEITRNVGVQLMYWISKIALQENLTPASEFSC